MILENIRAFTFFFFSLSLSLLDKGTRRENYRVICFWINCQKNVHTNKRLPFFRSPSILFFFSFS